MNRYGGELERSPNAIQSESSDETGVFGVDGSALSAGYNVIQVKNLGTKPMEIKRVELAIRFPKKS